MSDKIIHRGETMLISIEAEDFPVGGALATKADADDVTIISSEAAALLEIARGEGDS